MKFRWVLLLLGISTVFFALGMLWLPFLLAFAGGNLAAANCLFILHFATSKILGDVNDFEQIINRNNLAYAVYFLCVGIIIVVAFGAAFLVFLTLK